MRRLILATVALAAAVALPTGAEAVPCYGVVAGDVEAGVCAGGECTDLCYIVVDPYCRGIAPKYCNAIDGIG